MIIYSPVGGCMFTFHLISMQVSIFLIRWINCKVRWLMLTSLILRCIRMKLIFFSLVITKLEIFLRNQIGANLDLYFLIIRTACISVRTF